MLVHFILPNNMNAQFSLGLCPGSATPPLLSCYWLLLVVLADDNRPNMLVGVIVKTRPKRSSSSLDQSRGKRSKGDELDDEPYEPPGIDDIIPGEPETPSPTTTPKPTEPLLTPTGTTLYFPSRFLFYP